MLDWITNEKPIHTYNLLNQRIKWIRDAEALPPLDYPSLQDVLGYRYRIENSLLSRYGYNSLSEALHNVGYSYDTWKYMYDYIYGSSENISFGTNWINNRNYDEMINILNTMYIIVPSQIIAQVSGNFDGFIYDNDYKTLEEPYDWYS
jgi:hypothetical protein